MMSSPATRPAWRGRSSIGKGSHRVSRIVRRSPSPATVISLLALFVALGGTAYAATGGTLILGHANSATTATSLTSTVSTAAALTVTDTGGKPAARFVTNTGVAPFQVKSGTKVAKLNADKLDDLDSTAFARADVATGFSQTVAPNSFGYYFTFGGGMIEIGYTCPATLTNNGDMLVRTLGNDAGATAFIDSGADNPGFSRGATAMATLSQPLRQVTRGSSRPMARRASSSSMSPR